MSKLYRILKNRSIYLGMLTIFLTFSLKMSSIDDFLANRFSLIFTFEVNMLVTGIFLIVAIIKCNIRWPLDLFQRQQKVT